MSPKQTIIWNRMCEQERLYGRKYIMTLDEAVRLVGGNIYTNARKHVGDVLNRMVDAGIIERRKARGTYQLTKPAPPQWPDWMTPKP